MRTTSTHHGACEGGCDSSVNNSMRIIPKAKTSVAHETELASPKACSGAMYAGVPSIMPVGVTSLPPSWASPKSTTLTNSSSAPAFCSKKMFAGFKSRWSIGPGWRIWCAVFNGGGQLVENRQRHSRVR